MATIDEIKQQAEAVKNASHVGENTALRVGGVLVDLCEWMKKLSDNGGDLSSYLTKTEASRNYAAKSHTHSVASITGFEDAVKLIKVSNATNADKAKQLANPRLIWGQSFDGTNNINGNLYIGSAEDDSIQLTNKGLAFFDQNNAINNAYYKKDSIGLYDIANDDCCEVFNFSDSTFTFDPGDYEFDIVFNCAVTCSTSDNMLYIGNEHNSGLIVFSAESTMTFAYNGKNYNFNVAKAIEQGILTI